MGGCCEGLPNSKDGKDCLAFDAYNNGDHVRQMDNNELAEFICGICVSKSRVIFADVDTLSSDYKIVREWLSKPHGGGK
jgi:hypothetical protein